MNAKEFYSREEVQDAIVREAEGKEIGVRYSWGFGKRPDTLINAADIFELAKNDALSFHYSEETWQDPLLLKQTNTPREIEELRNGWDLVIDIDTPYFPYSKVAAKYVAEVLKYHGIRTIGCKFSGNKGFHLAVPFESFPKKMNGKETRTLFPEAPRKIATYIKAKIQAKVVQEIKGMHSLSQMEKLLDKPAEELKEMDDLVEIDTVLISSRHLCRMPYSINEKSGLVSIPIKLEELDLFERESAKPEDVNEFPIFLDRENAVDGEASGLFVEAFDFVEEKSIFLPDESSLPKQQNFEEMKNAAPEATFPPAIKKILEGMEEGKKRALFVLTHFLANVGWNYESIEHKARSWNGKNHPPLREVYIQSQLRYFKQHGKKLPPNYDGDYYSGIGIPPTPEELSSKNPVTYTRRKVFVLEASAKKPKKAAKKGKKEEVKEENKESEGVKREEEETKIDTEVKENKN